MLKMSLIAACSLTIACAQEPKNMLPSVDLRNESTFTLYTLYAAPCDARDWGENHLLGRPVSPGNGFTLALEPGCWDLLVDGGAGGKDTFWTWTGLVLDKGDVLELQAHEIERLK